MNRRRLAFVLVVVALAVAAQLASARSASHAHSGGSHESTLTALGHLTRPGSDLRVPC